MRYQLIALVLLPVLFSASLLCGAEEDLKKLIDGAGSKDRETCLAAIDGLGELGAGAADAVSALVAAMQRPDAEIAWHACRTLGDIGPKASAAVPALTKALQHENAKVRGYAAFALGRIGASAGPSVDKLIETAFDKDPLVRRAAMRAVRAIDPPPEKTLPLVVKLLEEGDPALVVQVLHSLAEQGKDAVPRLRAALKHERAAYWACLVIADIGPDAAETVPELTDVLRHADPDVRLQAALALGAIGHAAQAAAPAMVNVLEKDEFSHVRLAAIYALAEMRAEGDTDDQALERLTKNDDQFLRMLSSWALARLHPDDPAVVKRAVEQLVAGLESDDNGVQSAAGRALVDLKAPPEIAGPALVAALQDDDPAVIGNALDALAALGPKVLDRLIPALQNKELRRFAVGVLQRLGPQAAPAVPALAEILASPDADPELRREVQLALAAIGPEAKATVPSLIESLSSPESDVQASAAYALGKIGPGAAGAAPKLRELFASDDERIQRVATWALIRILPNDAQLIARAVPLLIGGLQNERELVRLEAAVALGDLGAAAKGAIEPLKKLLTDESPSVRAAAAEAIGKLEK